MTPKGTNGIFILMRVLEKIFLFFFVLFALSINKAESEDLTKKTACKAGSFSVCSQVDADDPEAESMYKHGCEGQDAYSCSRLGQFYENRKRYDEALRFYKMACSKNEPYGCNDYDDLSLKVCYKEKIKSKCGLVKPTGIYIGLDFMNTPDESKLDAFSKFDVGGSDFEEYLETAARNGNVLIYRGLIRLLVKGTANKETTDRLQSLLAAEMIRFHPKETIEAISDEVVPIAKFAKLENALFCHAGDLTKEEWGDGGYEGEEYEEEMASRADLVKQQTKEIEALKLSPKEKPIQDKILKIYGKFIKAHYKPQQSKTT